MANPYFHTQNPTTLRDFASKRLVSDATGSRVVETFHHLPTHVHATFRQTLETRTNSPANISDVTQHGHVVAKREKIVIFRN